MLQVPILAMNRNIKSNEDDAEYRGASLQVNTCLGVKRDDNQGSCLSVAGHQS